MDHRTEPVSDGATPTPNPLPLGGGLNVGTGVRRPSTRLYTVVLIILSFLLLLCAGIPVAAEFGRWSMFWAEQPVKNEFHENRYDRWGTHLMLGENVVALRRTYSFQSGPRPFSHPESDAASRSLAWTGLKPTGASKPYRVLRWDANGPYIVLPAWPVGIVAVCMCCVPITLVWRRRRAIVRELRLQCRRCAYYLRGLPEASVCPECAKPISAWVKEQVISKN